MLSFERTPPLIMHRCGFGMVNLEGRGLEYLLRTQSVRLNHYRFERLNSVLKGQPYFVRIVSLKFESYRFEAVELAGEVHGLWNIFVKYVVEFCASCRTCKPEIVTCSVSVSMNCSVRQAKGN